MPSSLGGRGLYSYQSTLGMIPGAASDFSSNIANSYLSGLDSIRRQKEAENAKEQDRRDRKTAKREQRQALGLNIGLGVGGAALGAGLGAIMAAPAGGLTPAAGAGIGGATGGGGASGLTAALPDPGFDPSTVQATAPHVPATQPAQSLGTSFMDDGGMYDVAPQPDFVGGSTFRPNPTFEPQEPLPASSPYNTNPSAGLQPTSSGYDPNFAGNMDKPLGVGTTARDALYRGGAFSPTTDSIAATSGLTSNSVPRFGALGNSRGAAFGNLFLQGLGSAGIPGLAGVAQGITNAQNFNYRQGIDNRNFNYQLGRDAQSDAFRNESLGIQREGLDARKAYYDSRLRNGGGLGQNRIPADVRSIELAIERGWITPDQAGERYRAGRINPIDAYMAEIRTMGDPRLWSDEQEARANEIGMNLRNFQSGSSLGSGYQTGNGSSNFTPQQQELEKMHGEGMPDELYRRKRQELGY